MDEHQIDIKDISLDGSYEGYLWWSNKEQPDVYKNERLGSFPPNSLIPFIVEGSLYDPEKKVSYSIKFLEGEHKVYRFDLKELAGKSHTSKSYLAGFDGASRLFVRLYWLPCQDEFCNGFDVLKPAMQVFVGFNEKED